MISSLHGYQQLAQFGKLCYPTAGTIGVNWDGQIKVWINENWAINQLASPAHSEELVVEELINLVEERTEGHFDFAQKDECNRNMYNKTFDIMQAILADYLMQFHQGKRSLIGKLAVMKGQYYNNSKGQSYDSQQNAQTRVSLWSSENKDYQRQINKQNKTKV